MPYSEDEPVFINNSIFAPFKALIRFSVPVKLDFIIFAVSFWKEYPPYTAAWITICGFIFFIIFSKLTASFKSTEYSEIFPAIFRILHLSDVLRVKTDI